MADFNTSNPGGGVNSPFRAQQPVVNDAIASGLNSVTRVAQVGLEAFGNAAQNKRATQIAGVAQEFRNSAIEVADAVHQGRLSSADAESMLLANYATFTNKYPMLADEFTQIHKEFVGTEGLGKVAVEGTWAEQQKLKQLEAGVAAGYVDPNADEYTRNTQLSNYMEAQRAKELLADIQARESLLSTQLGNRASEFNWQRQQMQYQSQQAIVSIAGSEAVRAEGEFAKIVRSMQNGEITQDEAQQLARQYMYGVRATASQIGAQAGSDFVNPLIMPIEMLYENAIKVIDGKESLDNLTRANERALAIATAGWLANPERARLVSGSSLFPQSDLLRLETRLSDSITRYIRGGVEEDVTENPFPKAESDKQGFQQYLNLILRPGMRQVVGGTADEQVSAEVERSINSIIQSIPAYQGAATNLSDYNQVVEFLASEDFGKYVSSKGGLHPDLQSQAFAVLQMNYDQEALRMLDEFWEKGGGLDFVRYPDRAFGGQVRWNLVPKDLIKPVFKGSGVSFVAREGLSPDDQRAASHIISKANTVAAPVLNKLIRIGAHFDGNQNYRAMWDKVYSPLFGKVGKDGMTIEE